MSIIKAKIGEVNVVVNKSFNSSSVPYAKKILGMRDSSTVIRLLSTSLKLFNVG